MDEYNFQQGLEESLRIIENVKARPKLVAVYGWPNSGKSYLINAIGKCLEERGVEVYKGSGSLREEFYEGIRDRPHSFKDVLLIHCAWDRKIIFVPGLRRVVFEDEDPNELSNRILNRKVDLNIGIYNPNHFLKLEGEYDFIIKNLDSVRKPKA
ncbi:MAG: hypothetical protein Q7S27_01065 [Nanoarchaeota archaeon]|nr:hypothetical protein [Nanoarchaeota archaeon]